LAFDLIELEVPNAEAYRLGSEEVKQTTFRLDDTLFPPSKTPAQSILFTKRKGRLSRLSAWSSGFGESRMMYNS
jgi:outer membrane lipoprotein-sorting protein